MESRRDQTQVVNRILETRLLAPDVKYFRVEAPKVARKRRAGQFVIVRRQLGKPILM